MAPSLNCQTEWHPKQELEEVRGFFSPSKAPGFYSHALRIIYAVYKNYIHSVLLGGKCIWILSTTASCNGKSTD